MTEKTEEKKDVVPGEYRERYKATGGTNGDFIATSLSKVAEDGVEALASVKRENGIDKDRWAGFNPGMQRMNLANVLRGSFLKGETITILGKQYNAKHLAQGPFARVDASGEDAPVGCVWELGVTCHERLAWHRFLFSDRTEAAKRAWLADRYAGPV